MTFEAQARKQCSKKLRFVQRPHWCFTELLPKRSPAALSLWPGPSPRPPRHHKATGFLVQRPMRRRKAPPESFPTPPGRSSRSQGSFCPPRGLPAPPPERRPVPLERRPTVTALEYCGRTCTPQANKWQLRRVDARTIRPPCRECRHSVPFRTIHPPATRRRRRVLGHDRRPGAEHFLSAHW